MRRLKDIEREGDEHSPLYLRFSHHVIERTEAYASGEINVDVDHCGEVVGIEALSLGADQLDAPTEITRHYDSGLSALIHAPRKG